MKQNRIHCTKNTKRKRGSVNAVVRVTYELLLHDSAPPLGQGGYATTAAKQPYHPFQLIIPSFNKVFSFCSSITSARRVVTVSYTHLDVYKRQAVCGTIRLQQTLPQRPI